MENSLQVVYVNYHAAHLLEHSLHSLRTSASDAPDLEVTVVDNSQDDEEHDRLASMLPAPAHLIRTGENLGFARGCNLGARAGRSKHVLFLNPDTIVPPQTIARLWEELERRQGGALIGPRHFADLEMRFAHAPVRGTRLFDQAWDLCYARGWDSGRPLRYLRARGRLAERRGAVRVRTISGGCLAVSRAAFDRIGGWNEDYWMYGEDMELCARARRRGVEVLYFPDIPIVHFMEASARLLPERVAEARASARHRFKRARYGRIAHGLDRWVTARLRSLLPARDDPWRSAVPLEDHRLAAPLSSGRWAVEIGRSPLFDNCLTAFPEERSLTLPEKLLTWLPPGEYFLRVAGEQTRDRWHESALYRLQRPSSEPQRGRGQPDEGSVPVCLDQHVSGR